MRKLPNPFYPTCGLPPDLECRSGFPSFPRQRQSDRPQVAFTPRAAPPMSVAEFVLVVFCAIAMVAATGAHA